MELFLQQGAQMQELGSSIVQAHPGTTVVLSPKDFKSESQLIDYAKKVTAKGGKVLLDPQLFLLKIGSGAARIPAVQYWQHVHATAKLVEGVLELNRKIDSDRVILPAPCLETVNDESLDGIRAIVDAARGVKEVGFLSLCLPGDFFRSERQYNRLSRFLEMTDVPGVYLLPERVDDDYLTDDPVWLHRLLEFCADMKMFGKNVIVGYASHQLLPLACSAVDAMAAGKGKATRIFWIDSFKKMEEGDIGFARPKPSYYCPQALTEFSLKYMDLACAESVLELMKPGNLCADEAVMRMLSSRSPLSCEYTLRDGYLNYFNLLKQQCELASKGQNFHDRIMWQKNLLETADELLSILHKHRVRGLLKDFSKYIDVTRSALQSFEETRGVNLIMMEPLFKTH